MKRTLKVVLVYLAVIALGWLDQSRGQENAAEPTTSAGQVVPNTAAVDQVVPVEQDASRLQPAKSPIGLRS